MFKFTNRLLAPTITAIVVLTVSGCESTGGFGTIDGFGGELDDSSDLSAKVRRALRNAPQTAVNRILVSQVGEDTVKLSGSVRDSATSYEAERVANAVAGVRHVFNELHIN